MQPGWGGHTRELRCCIMRTTSPGRRGQWTQSDSTTETAGALAAGFACFISSSAVDAYITLPLSILHQPV